MTLAPVEQAERYVAEGERYIARQHEIVAALKRRGRRTALRTAQVLLQTFGAGATVSHLCPGPAAHQARRRRMKRAPEAPRSLSPLAQRLHGLPCR